MNSRINFEDNIFILNTRIRMIRNLLLLDADPELFLEKTLDDLGFTGRSLESLFTRLSENERYIEREEQLHNLEETESGFQELLAGMQNGQGSLQARQFPAILPQLAFLLARSQERKKEIARLIRSRGERGGQEPLVSSDELAELLRDME